MQVIPAPGWQELAARIVSKRGIVLLVGESDCGKSTLARYILAELVGRGLEAALVDADIGQSSLWLPGTVSMACFHTPAELAEFRPERFAFIGAVSPARVIPFLVAETRRLTRLAAQRASVVVVDTTGLVTGNLGLYLKREKIRALNPSLVVAMERHDELSPLLAHLGETPFVILNPSPEVRRRSTEARIRFRQAKLAAYFADDGPHFLPLHGIELRRFGRPADRTGLAVPAGTVIGLNHGPDTRALGVVSEWDEDSVLCVAPPFSPHGINRIVTGELTFDSGLISDTL